MSYIIEKVREQMTFGTLSDGIEAENPVCFIEAFVEKIDLLNERIFFEEIRLSA